jgi:hypothetical protein
LNLNWFVYIRVALYGHNQNTKKKKTVAVGPAGAVAHPIGPGGKYCLQ